MKKNDHNPLLSIKQPILMIDKSYYLEGAKQCPSPNCSERQSDEISLLVIHNISLPPGEFGGGNVEKLFTNQLAPEDHPYFKEISSLKVSSHLLIDRKGIVTQFVPFIWLLGMLEFQVFRVLITAINFQSVQSSKELMTLITQQNSINL